MRGRLAADVHGPNAPKREPSDAGCDEDAARAPTWNRPARAASAVAADAWKNRRPWRPPVLEPEPNAARKAFRPAPAALEGGRAAAEAAVVRADRN